MPTCSKQRSTIEQKPFIVGFGLLNLRQKIGGAIEKLGAVRCEERFVGGDDIFAAFDQSFDMFEHQSRNL